MKNYYNREENVFSENEYFEFILKNLIIKLINDYLNKMNINNINTPLEKIRVYDTIIVERTFNSNKISRNSISYNYKDYNSFCIYLDDLIKKYHIGKLSIIKNRSNPVYDTANVIIDTNLRNMINVYNKIGSNSIINYEEKYNNNKVYIEGNYYEQLSDNYYDLLLNNLLIKIVESMIFCDKDYNKKYKWIIEINASSLNSNIRYDDKIIKLFIDRYTWNDFINILNAFLKTYKIGKLQKVGKNSFNWEFNVSINEILNTYYMELQRLDYYKEKELLLTKK